MKCKDKIQYLTFVDAKIACDKLFVKEKVKLSPYICDECGLYHVTKIKLSWMKHWKNNGTWKNKSVKQ